MKARSHPVVLSLALVLLAPISCRAADAASSSHLFVDPDDPTVAAVRQVGVRIIDQCGAALVAEMKRTLANSSPALAIGILHLQEYKLPAPVRGQPVVTELRRTSLQVRNPANAPDDADLAALSRIQHELEAGDPVSDVLVQRVDRPGRPVEWRVYRPLVTMKGCLDCHGPADALAPGVAETLQVYFPRDQATGFKAGAWRGLLRASLAVPETP